RAFSDAGIGTRVIESGQWAALPSVQTLKRLPDAFEKVSIIAACGFTEMRTTETTTAAEGPTVAQRLASTGIMMMTGLPIRIGPKKQKNETKIERRTDDQLFFEIVGGSPPARYRIDARNFDYTCLGAKKTYSAAVNGRVLLKELAATYPDAWLNAGAT